MLESCGFPGARAKDHTQNNRLWGPHSVKACKFVSFVHTVALPLATLSKIRVAELRAWKPGDAVET